MELNLEELEKRVKLLDLKLEIKELEGKKKSSPANFFSKDNAPIITAMIGGVISLLVLLLQKHAETTLERQKFAQSIIQKIIDKDSGREERIKADLLFYSKLGLIDITNITKDTVIGGKDTSIFTTPIPGFNIQGVSEDQKDILKSSLTSFQTYLQSLGYRQTGKEVNVSIIPQREMICYYKQDSIIVSIDYSKDLDLPHRELTHHALLVGKTYERIYNAYWYAAIESGLAFYFPCSYKNDPNFGNVSKNISPYFPILITDKDKFTTATPDTYQSEARKWASAFWQLRSLIGSHTADKILFQAWMSTDNNAISNNRPSDFVNVLIKMVNESGQQTQISTLVAIFKNRGLAI